MDSMTTSDVPAIGVQFPNTEKPKIPIHKTQAKMPVQGIARDGPGVKYLGLQKVQS